MEAKRPTKIIRLAALDSWLACGWQILSYGSDDSVVIFFGGKK